jgi:hypothetical protein
LWQAAPGSARRCAGKEAKVSAPFFAIIMLRQRFDLLQ